MGRKRGEGDYVREEEDCEGMERNEVRREGKIIGRGFTGCCSGKLYGKGQGVA